MISQIGYRSWIKRWTQYQLQMMLIQRTRSRRGEELLQVMADYRMNKQTLAKIRTVPVILKSVCQPLDERPPPAVYIQAANPVEVDLVILEKRRYQHQV